jgi:predicted phage-related endonuclease
MSTIELTSKIRELKSLKQMADELAAEITAIEDTIKAEMTARNTVEMTIDVFKIRWTPVIGTRFDTTRFKSDHADLYTAYTKQTESRRFTVA